jgi:hypothetical protein
MNGWLTAVIIVAVIGAGGGIGWSFLAKEHCEAGIGICFITKFLEVRLNP